MLLMRQGWEMTMSRPLPDMGDHFSHRMHPDPWVDDDVSASPTLFLFASRPETRGLPQHHLRIRTARAALEIGKLGEVGVHWRKSVPRTSPCIPSL